MQYTKIIPYINAEVKDLDTVLQLAKDYSYGGADELLIYNFTKKDADRERFLSLSRKIAEEIDIPFTLGIHVDRVEDIKKTIYAGANSVLIKYDSIEDKEVIKTSSKRFGADSIIISLDASELLLKTKDEIKNIIDLGPGKILVKNISLSPKITSIIDSFKLPVIIKDNLARNDINDLLSIDSAYGIATSFYKGKDLMRVKHRLKEDGFKINTYESKLPFTEFKTNDQGLIPVVTQDYKTGQVLMLAYMNKEAYNETIASGRMTYYSRSKSRLWVKGETSGHFQYLKKLFIDCDKDTLLAKVDQIGVACHTGNPSCFYTNLVEREYKNTNPSSVFEDVYDVIMSRKKSPKEGSYTNYLFDQGLDKILKKCGEEATEIIIAAKNPDSEELKYEISDFLYHLMVLMVEQGLNWTDIIKELEHRR